MVPPAWSVGTGTGTASAGAVALSPGCVSPLVSAQSWKSLKKIIVKFSIHHLRHCRTITISRPQSAPGAEKLLPICDHGR